MRVPGHWEGTMVVDYIKSNVAKVHHKPLPTQQNPTS